MFKNHATLHAYVKRSSVVLSNLLPQCYQTWRNSAKVAYFKTPWRVKIGGVRHQKCGLFLAAPRFWLNIGEKSRFSPKLGVFHIVKKFIQSA